MLPAKDQKSTEKANQDSDEKPIGFEPEDKPTPTAGKLLLIIMAVLLLYLGFQGLRDVENIPQEPQPLSSCANGYLSGTPYRQMQSIPDYYSNSYNPQSCNFSKYETQNGVPDAYTKYQSQLKEQNNLETQLQQAQSQLSQTESQINQFQNNYNLSLQEKIANENRVGLTPDQLRAQIQSYESQRNFQKQNVANLTNQLNSKETGIKAASANLQSARDKAQSAYDKDNAIYRIKVFAIQALLVFPLFFFFLNIYLKLKAKDSPHTVIATTLLAVSGFFVMQITIMYLWSTFLQNLLEIVMSLIKNFPLAKTLIYYIGMLLVIAIFGGAVYKLQKKIFDPQRVRLRRLRTHKCPYCEFPFDFTAQYCPSCGKQLMQKCPSCSQMRYTIMKHCPSCGKEESNTL